MLQHICLALIDPTPTMRVKAVKLLNRHCLKEQMSFVPAVRYALETGALIVTPTKAQVETYNNVEKAILGEGSEPIHISRPEKLYNIADLSTEQISFCGGPQGVIREDREIQERNTFVSDLKLYPGQQVQIRLNGKSENGVEYYNGDICQFLDYNKEEDICVVRRRKDGKIIQVGKVEHKTEYETDIGKIGYKAFPIIPAISTNTHKVQGQTLSKIIIDPTNIKCFRANIPNMLYVMFSRAKLTSDIVLTEKIDEAWVVSPEINEYLVGLWDIDFMETYPRANLNVLDNYLAEL
jgi:ATP-dependent exoDNAse (exonuclease V) alpha subunit